MLVVLLITGFRFGAGIGLFGIVRRGIVRRGILDFAFDAVVIPFQSGGIFNKAFSAFEEGFCSLKQRFRFLA